jgi:hypothetical protein
MRLAQENKNMTPFQTTSQLFQLSFTAIVAILLGGLLANRISDRRPSTLRVEISLLILTGMSLTLLFGDSILQVFWQVDGSLAAINELVLLVRSILSFLVIIAIFNLTLNIAEKTGWLKLVTAFVLVALSTSFLEFHLKLPTISALQAFWLFSYGLCMTILVASYIVVRIHRRATRLSQQTPPSDSEALHEADEPQEA